MCFTLPSGDRKGRPYWLRSIAGKAPQQSVSRVIPLLLYMANCRLTTPRMHAYTVNIPGNKMKGVSLLCV